MGTRSAALAVLLCAAVIGLAFAVAPSTSQHPSPGPARPRGQLLYRTATVDGPPFRMSSSAFAANSTLSVATLHGPRGVTLEIAPTCGGPQPLSLEYHQTRDGAQLSQDFSGPASVCRFGREFRTLTLTAHWPAALRLHLLATLEPRHQVATNQVHGGCFATAELLTYRVTGTVRAHIHPRALGAFTAAPARLTVSTTQIPSCALNQDDGAYEGDFTFGGPTVRRSYVPPPPTGDDFTAYRGDDQLDASHLPSEGVALSTDSIHNDPVHGITDTPQLLLPIRDFRTRPDDLRSARFPADSPFSTGSLTYRETRACRPGADATQGVLDGAITIEDPGALRVTVTGRDLGLAQLSGPRASANGCPAPR